jgi:hypothetical protein
LESVITGMCDAYPREIGRNRSKFVFGLILFCFVCALPTTTYVSIESKFFLLFMKISIFCKQKGWSIFNTSVG